MFKAVMIVCLLSGQTCFQFWDLEGPYTSRDACQARLEQWQDWAGKMALATDVTVVEKRCRKVRVQ